MIGVILAAAVAAQSLATLPTVPDPALTPGVVDPAKTLDVICVPGFTARPGVRHVTEATKRAVFAEYHIDPHGPGAPFEIDHLISLENGGSNDIRNLWPQSYLTKPNAHDKDRLENAAHKLACSGKIMLEQDQKMLSTGWIAGYLQYVGPLPK